MSTNCIKCVKNQRTGPDLLCDWCRTTPPPTGRVIPCPFCRGKTQCDCDMCWGRGRILHPKDASAAKDAEIVALREVLHRARIRLRHFDNGEDDETGRIINDIDAILFPALTANQTTTPEDGK